MVRQASDRAGLVSAGQRSINSNAAIDGADDNDPSQGNQRGGNETRDASAFAVGETWPPGRPNRVLLSPAVREFQVVRSGAGAETGRTGGGFTNVVTRSGANRTRGEGFYDSRNKTLTARDAFDHRTRQPGAEPVRRRHRRRGRAEFLMSSAHTRW
jgi:hypothetical protein